jgi:hypothetical protein
VTAGVGIAWWERRVRHELFDRPTVLVMPVALHPALLHGPALWEPLQAAMRASRLRRHSIAGRTGSRLHGAGAKIDACA